MSTTIIYKNFNINIMKYTYENNTEFEIRKWFVLKNLKHTFEYGFNNIDKSMYFDELVNYSKIHVQRKIYNCTYNEYIMKIYDLLEKNLFI